MCLHTVQACRNFNTSLTIGDESAANLGPSVHVSRLLLFGGGYVILDSFSAICYTYLPHLAAEHFVGPVLNLRQVSTVYTNTPEFKIFECITFSTLHLHIYVQPLYNYCYHGAFSVIEIKLQKNTFQIILELAHQTFIETRFKKNCILNWSVGVMFYAKAKVLISMLRRSIQG